MKQLPPLRAGADVVFQATFFDGDFLGYADFLIKEGSAGRESPGRYAVWDTKFARHAKVGALLQLAAYGDQLIQLGLAPAPRVTLVLGNLGPQRPLTRRSAACVPRAPRPVPRTDRGPPRRRSPAEVAAARCRPLRTVRLLRRAGEQYTVTC